LPPTAASLRDNGRLLFNVESLAKAAKAYEGRIKRAEEAKSMAYIGSSAPMRKGPFPIGLCATGARRKGGRVQVVEFFPLSRPVSAGHDRDRTVHDRHGCSLRPQHGPRRLLANRLARGSRCPEQFGHLSTRLGKSHSRRPIATFCSILSQNEKPISARGP